MCCYIQWYVNILPVKTNDGMVVVEEEEIKGGVENLI